MKFLGRSFRSVPLIWQFTVYSLQMAEEKKRLIFSSKKFVGFFVNILTWSYCNDIDIFFTGESINNPDPF